MVVGPVDNNVFVLRCRATGDAVLLDAANEHDRLLDLCRALGVRSVLETHGHWDHIQAVPQLRDAGYEVHVTAEDAEMLPSYDQVLTHDSVTQFLARRDDGSIVGVSTLATFPIPTAIRAWIAVVS